MRIRPATRLDAPVIAHAEWETAETPGLLVGRPGEIPVSAFAAKIEELGPQGAYCVAERGGHIVAHAFLEPMKMIGNAHVFSLTLVVHPREARKGIGTALLAHMLSWARANSELQKIELLVRATNDRAIALYRRFGFVEEGRLRARVRTADGDLIDDVVMAWFADRR